MKAQNADKNVFGIVGNTPLVEITKLSGCASFGSRIFAKLEFLNPSGSIKDRMAKFMLEDAEERGLLKNKKIVEATSGNTGISFAMLCAARGYEFTAVMPQTASMERRALMRQYGAKIVLTETFGCEQAVKVAREIAARESAWLPDQYANEANAHAHEKTTGMEILAQAARVDAFVAGIGTGGTLIGVGRAVRAKFPDALVAGVEPEESPTINSGKHGVHGIQGISIGFIPELYERNKRLVNEVVRVNTREAIECAKQLSLREGLRAGISSGANVCAALRVAKKIEKSGGTVVTILPDASDRYYSTPLFE